MTPDRRKAIEDWARAHGSERLRKAIELGFVAESEGIYRDDRLAIDLPGWVWWARECELSDIRNPSEMGLDALERARAFSSAAGAARLCKARWPGTEWREVVLLPIDWARGKLALLEIPSDPRTKRHKFVENDEDDLCKECRGLWSDPIHAVRE